jgi:hypothetical protein
MGVLGKRDAARPADRKRSDPKTGAHRSGANKESKMRITSLTTLLALTLAVPAAAEPNWKAVGQALGKEGSVQPGGIYRVGLPRTDLKVTLDGVEIKPGFALGSWLAFKSMGDDAMVMGDPCSPRRR